MEKQKDEETKICEICSCEYDANGEPGGLPYAMCPDCAEAYRIYHEATDWMQ